MAWTDPRTWVTDELVTAAIMNTHVRDNLNSIMHLVVRKPSDESVTSSTTLQNDDHLLLTAGANDVWRCQFELIYDAGTTGDIKLAFTFPSGRIDFSTTFVDESGTATFRRWNTATSPSGELAIYGPAGVMTFVLSGVFANGVTGGNLQLQWAQNTSSGTATVMKANSTLWAAKIA